MLYDVVDEFEQCVAEYAGALYGVSCNSCTSAIMLSAALRFDQGYPRWATLPKHTYVGVPQAILCANPHAKLQFMHLVWSGVYRINNLYITDGARRFCRGMYRGGLHCLSFHETKHLPIGRGGMILTDNREEAGLLRRMRFDGRTPGVHPKDETFDVLGWHVHMKPDDAARGLMLMSGVKDWNRDLPWGPGTNCDYPDLSWVPLFQEGV